MSIFNVDFPLLSKLMLPLQLRTRLLLALAKTCVSPISDFYDNFMTHRAENLYIIKHNGQVCRLEAMLNDRFDQALRRIYITDGVSISATMIWQRIEAKPLYIKQRSEADPVYMRQQSELTIGGSFVVKVPAALVFDPTYMRSSVNEYKIAGKPFTIITF